MGIKLQLKNTWKRYFLLHNNYPHLRFQFLNPNNFGYAVPSTQSVGTQHTRLRWAVCWWHKRWVIIEFPSRQSSCPVRHVKVWDDERIDIVKPTRGIIIMWLKWDHGRIWFELVGAKAQVKSFFLDIRHDVIGTDTELCIDLMGTFVVYGRSIENSILCMIGGRGSQVCNKFSTHWSILL